MLIQSQGRILSEIQHLVLLFLLDVCLYVVHLIVFYSLHLKWFEVALSVLCCLSTESRAACRTLMKVFVIIYHR